MKSQQKIPKDLKLKIGSVKEVFWTSVRDNAKLLLEEAKNSIMLQTEVIKMAELQIKKEKHLNSFRSNK